MSGWGGGVGAEESTTVALSRDKEGEKENVQRRERKKENVQRREREKERERASNRRLNNKLNMHTFINNEKCYLNNSQINI